MFIAALFTRAQRWKQPKHLSADDQINKMWPIYTVEYYSALKREDILTHLTPWMNLGYNMLSGINQTQKVNSV